MSRIIGHGRYARETYPTRSSSGAGSSLISGWDVVVPDDEGGELLFQDSTGAILFRHPRNNEQEVPSFLQVVFAPAQISAGDTLYVTYSGKWQFSADDTEGPTFDASIDFAVGISVDGGATWQIDEIGKSDNVNLADNVSEAEDVVNEVSFARRWAVIVPAISNQNVIVGILVRVETPETGGSPAIIHEGDEGGARLIVERWLAASIIDSPEDPTVWTPATISPPPWRPDP